MLDVCRVTIKMLREDKWGWVEVQTKQNNQQEPTTTAPSPSKREEEQTAGCTPLRQLVPHPKGGWVFRHGRSGSKERRGTHNRLIHYAVYHIQRVWIFRYNPWAARGTLEERLFFFFFTHVDEYQRATCGNSVSSGMQVGPCTWPAPCSVLTAAMDVGRFVDISVS